MIHWGVMEKEKKYYSIIQWKKIMFYIIISTLSDFFKVYRKKTKMAEDPELAKIRAQRMAEMQSQVTMKCFRNFFH